VGLDRSGMVRRRDHKETPREDRSDGLGNRRVRVQTITGRESTKPIEQERVERGGMRREAKTASRG